jgi:hypothetical protein
MNKKNWYGAWIFIYSLVSYSLFLRLGFWWTVGIMTALISAQKIWKFKLNER